MYTPSGRQNLQQKRYLHFARLGTGRFRIRCRCCSGRQSCVWVRRRRTFPTHRRRSDPDKCRVCRLPVILFQHSMLDKDKLLKILAYHLGEKTPPTNCWNRNLVETIDMSLGVTSLKYNQSAFRLNLSHVTHRDTVSGTKL